MRYLFAMALMPIAVLVSQDLCAAEPPVAGSYAISIGRKSCSVADDVLVKGDLVLFAQALQKKDRDRFDSTRFDFPGAVETVNGCFVLDSLVKNDNIYAGIEKLGFTSWSKQGDILRMSLFHSPDAGYEALLKQAPNELRGTGTSWGAGMGAPKRHTQEVIVARRTGDADLAKCVFETAEEAKRREFRTDPIRNRIRELEDAYRTRLSESLSASAIPYDWVMAVLIGVTGPSLEVRYGKSRALAVRAATAAPDDLLAQWVALYQTHRSVEIVAGGDAPLRAIQRLEPDNAAAWPEALGGAARNDDGDAVDAILARMATSARYDTHRSDIVKAKFDAYRRVAPPDEYFAVAVKYYPGISRETAPYHFAEGYDTGILVEDLPGLHELFVACGFNAHSMRSRSRAETCARIARLMAVNGTSLETNAAGEQLLSTTRLFTSEDVERERIHEWIGKQYWDAYGASDVFLQMPIAESVAYIGDWCRTGSEFETKRQAVARAGRPLLPPPGWTSPAAAYRNVSATARP